MQLSASGVGARRHGTLPAAPRASRSPGLRAARGLPLWSSVHRQPEETLPREHYIRESRKIIITIYIFFICENIESTDPKEYFFLGLVVFIYQRLINVLYMKWTNRCHSTDVHRQRADLSESLQEPSYIHGGETEAVLQEGFLWGATTCVSHCKIALIFLHESIFQFIPNQENI